MSKQTLLITAVVALTGLATVAAYAHGGATGIVKERMDQMVTLRDAMKTLKSQLAMGGAYDVDVVAGAAAAIKQNAGDHLTKLFPEGSLSMASEAKPNVWSNWDRFSAIATDLELYAGALEAAAIARIPNTATAPAMTMGMGMAPAKPDPAVLSMQAPMEAFTAVSDTCSACHTAFRQKKNH